MRTALEILGYTNTYHFDQAIIIRDCDMWLELLDAKYSDTPARRRRPVGRAGFDQLLGHRRAVTDAPCNMFAAELIAAYPDAKVVLVKRPFESWYRSFQVVVDT